MTPKESRWEPTWEVVEKIWDENVPGFDGWRAWDTWKNIDAGTRCTFRRWLSLGYAHRMKEEAARKAERQAAKDGLYYFDAEENVLDLDAVKAEYKRMGAEEAERRIVEWLRGRQADIGGAHRVGGCYDSAARAIKQGAHRQPSPSELRSQAVERILHRMLMAQWEAVQNDRTGPENGWSWVRYDEALPAERDICAKAIRASWDGLPQAAQDAAVEAELAKENE